MSSAVLDSSAVLALLFGEPGANAVRAVLPGALLSTVNLAEIVSKLAERGVPPDLALSSVMQIGVEIVDFDSNQAASVGALRPETRAAGLSIGDRACLTLARVRQLPAMTADRAWSSLAGFDVVAIRPER